MGTGKLNWIEIPARDVEASIRFYQAVFGWAIDRDERQPQYPMWYDSSGQVGGAFVTWRAPAGEGAGIVPSIAVRSIEETLAAVVRHGGSVEQPKKAIVEGKDWFATFRDPAGNTLMLYESAGESG